MSAASRRGQFVTYLTGSRSLQAWFRSPVLNRGFFISAVETISVGGGALDAPQGGLSFPAGRRGRRPLHFYFQTGKTMLYYNK